MDLKIPHKAPAVADPQTQSGDSFPMPGVEGHRVLVIDHDTELAGQMAGAINAHFRRELAFPFSHRNIATGRTSVLNDRNFTISRKKY